MVEINNNQRKAFLLARYGRRELDNIAEKRETAVMTSL